MSRAGSTRTVSAGNPPSGRERILGSFAELVAEHGYGHTSIADVAAKAGVSKGTVVHHFGAKEQMLAEVQLEYLHRRIREAERIVDSFATPYEQLVGIVYVLLRAHREDRIASRAFMREFTLFAETEAMRPIRRIRDDYHTIVSGIIRRGVADGTFRSGDTALTTLLVFGMCNHPWTWYRPDGPHTVLEIAESFLTTLLAGMATNAAPRHPVAAILDQANAVLEAVDAEAAVVNGRPNGVSVGI